MTRYCVLFFVAINSDCIIFYKPMVVNTIFVRNFHVVLRRVFLVFILCYTIRGSDKTLELIKLELRLFQFVYEEFLNNIIL